MTSRFHSSPHMLRATGAPRQLRQSSGCRTTQRPHFSEPFNHVSPSLLQAQLLRGGACHLRAGRGSTSQAEHQVAVVLTPAGGELAMLPLVACDILVSWCSSKSAPCTSRPRQGVHPGKGVDCTPPNPGQPSIGMTTAPTVPHSPQGPRPTAGSAGAPSTGAQQP